MSIRGRTFLLLLTAAVMAYAAAAPKPGEMRTSSEWPLLGGGTEQSQFSPLAQINDRNVAQLGLAWSADLPVADGLVGEPLVMDGTVYQGAPGGQIIANDVRTGALLWNFKPAASDLTKLPWPALWALHVNRGVAIDQHHVYIAAGDCRLFAVDRHTGKQVWEAQPCDPTTDYGITGAPRLGGGMVFIGESNAELGTDRGHVDAFDAATGKHLWRFYTMPGDPAAGFESKAMEMASKTWGKDYWKLAVGAAATWEGMTYDEKLKRLYVGVGNPGPENPDKRAPNNGDELFTNSIVALDAKTGQYLWHYQSTPHDAHDSDAVAQIIIADLPIAGRTRRVLMQAPKNGFFYVLDAQTGKFLSAGKYVPNQWASHVDPTTGRLVLANNPPQRSGEREGGGHDPWALMAYNSASGLVYLPAWAAYGRGRRGGVEMGRLIAWDPVAEKERWHVDIPPHQQNGGVLATAGNLVFQGTSNGTFQAYAADSGKRLWSFDVRGTILAAPVTVQIDGEQLILVPSGDGGAMASGPVDGGSPVAPWAQSRPRLLAFKLNGTAVLPPNPPSAKWPKPFVPRQPEALAQKGAGLFFSHHCYACHGINAEKGGLDPAVPDLRRIAPDIYQSMSQIVIGNVFRPVGMPDYSDVSEEDITAIKAMVINSAWRAYDAQQAVTGIRSLGPFGISVADLDRSDQFYAALGFKIGERTPMPHSVAKVLGADSPDAKVTMQELTRDGAGVLLLQLDPRPPRAASDGAAKQAGLTHLELMVDDVDQVAADIVRLGGTVLSQTRAHLTDVGPPTDIVFCRDPDGTLIVLVASHAAAAPSAPP